MLPAHARPQLVSEKMLQTSTGFATDPRRGEDPRPLVSAVEAGSPAERAGVKVGDRITKIGITERDRQSALVAILSGSPAESVENVLAEIQKPDRGGAEVVGRTDAGVRVAFGDLPSYLLARAAARATPDVGMTPVDRLDEITSARDWPRGKSELRISVERVADGKLETIDLPPFAPVTLGLYPTQVYETVSMVLL